MSVAGLTVCSTYRPPLVAIKQMAIRSLGKQHRMQRLRSRTLKETLSAVERLDSDGNYRIGTCPRRVAPEETECYMQL